MVGRELPDKCRAIVVFYPCFLRAFVPYGAGWGRQYKPVTREKALEWAESALSGAEESTGFRGFWIDPDGPEKWGEFARCIVSAEFINPKYA